MVVSRRPSARGRKWSLRPATSNHSGRGSGCWYRCRMLSLYACCGGPTVSTRRTSTKRAMTCPQQTPFSLRTFLPPAHWRLEGGWTALSRVPPPAWTTQVRLLGLSTPACVVLGEIAAPRPPWPLRMPAGCPLLGTPVGKLFLTCRPGLRSTSQVLNILTPEHSHRPVRHGRPAPALPGPTRRRQRVPALPTPVRMQYTLQFFRIITGARRGDHWQRDCRSTPRRHGAPRPPALLYSPFLQAKCSAKHLGQASTSPASPATCMQLPASCC